MAAALATIAASQKPPIAERNALHVHSEQARDERSRKEDRSEHGQDVELTVGR
jgi:hypothetical protein